MKTLSLMIWTLIIFYPAQSPAQTNAIETQLITCKEMLKTVTYWGGIIHEKLTQEVIARREASQYISGARQALHQLTENLQYQCMPQQKPIEN